MIACATPRRERTDPGNAAAAVAATAVAAAPAVVASGHQLVDHLLEPEGCLKIRILSSETGRLDVVSHDLAAMSKFNPDPNFHLHLSYLE